MPKINPRIKSIDDLLGLDAAEERPIEPTPSVSLPTKNTIITLPPQAIRAFRGHPFRLYEGDRLNDLVESISEHGVLNPAIIRKIERDEDGFEYEMLAGHNRQNAAAIANRELPCIELIVALPFEGHDSKWDAMSKQRLQIIIHNATKCIVIGQSGTTSDYKKRNYYMVDHADFLLAVYDNNRKLRSGTGQTVNYALKQNLRIIFLHPDTAEIS